MSKDLRKTINASATIYKLACMGFKEHADEGDKIIFWRKTDNLFITIYKGDEKPSGGGKVLTKKEAYDFLLEGADNVMCYEYGADNCEECKDKDECTCWTGMQKEDLNNAGIGEPDDFMDFEEFCRMGWENFELWD